MAGVKKDLDYYWNTYKKPISVSEFACVDGTSNLVFSLPPFSPNTKPALTCHSWHVSFDW
jgi:hypothetical protein